MTQSLRDIDPAAFARYMRTKYPAPVAHTPGPWAAVAPETPEGCWEIEDGFGRTATVYGEPSDPETVATARLIAQAPAMLDALRIAREHVKAAAEADLCFARQQEQQGMHGTAARCREAHDMRMCALALIDRTITAASGEEV